MAKDKDKPQAPPAGAPTVLTIDDAAVLDRIRDLIGEVSVEGIARLVLLAEERATAPETPTIDVKPPTLEECADILLTVLQPAHQDRVRDIAHENHWPKWAIILGAVARAADNMELHAGEFDPDWLNSPGAVKPTPSAIECETCHHAIPSGRRGQRFCCNAHGSGQAWHTDGCKVAEKLGLRTGNPGIPPAGATTGNAERVTPLPSQWGVPHGADRPTEPDADEINAAQRDAELVAAAKTAG